MKYALAAILLLGTGSSAIAQFQTNTRDLVTRANAPPTNPYALPGAPAPGAAPPSAVQPSAGTPSTAGVPAGQVQQRPADVPAPMRRGVRNQIEQQGTGRYPATSAADLAPQGRIQKAWADPRPAKNQVSPGHAQIQYTGGVMPVRTRVGMSTTVEFPKDVHIVDVLPANSTEFEVLLGEDQFNTFEIMPKAIGVDTSIKATDSKGTKYVFYTTSEGYNSTEVPDLIVSVSIPSAEPIEPVTRSKAADRAGILGDDFLRTVQFTGNLQADYQIFAQTEDALAIAPVAVWHDEINVYIYYGDRADQVPLPAVFVVEDETDRMVNAQVLGRKGELLVIDRLADRLTLQHGRKVVCIVKQAAAISTDATVAPAPATAAPAVTATPAGAGLDALRQLEHEYNPAPIPLTPPTAKKQ